MDLLQRVLNRHFVLELLPSLCILFDCVKLLKSAYNARKINFKRVENKYQIGVFFFYSQEVLKKVRPETPVHLAVGVDRSYMIALYIATMVVKFEISL